MFPWVYEFQWNAAHVIFLGAFFFAAFVIAATFMKAVIRSYSDFKTKKETAIRWHADFSELPDDARLCRHAFTGEAKHRICDNHFHCGSCEAHPKLLQRRQEDVSMPLYDKAVLGFSMPTGRLYHRGHTWVRKENDGTFTVGLDDFGKRLIGNPDSIDLPQPGTALYTNGIGWIMKKGNAVLRILSPIDGVVIARGNEEQDWYIKIQPDPEHPAMQHLLQGPEIGPWIMREMERLEMSMATAKLGATIADGGELMPEMHRYFPHADWEGIWGHMFLAV